MKCANCVKSSSGGLFREKCIPTDVLEVRLMQGLRHYRENCVAATRLGFCQFSPGLAPGSPLAAQPLS